MKEMTFQERMNMQPQRLIELSSPSGQRGCYVCAECYSRMTSMEPGSTYTPIRDGRGEEYCQVYRGLSNVWSECMSPDHPTAQS